MDLLCPLISGRSNGRVNDGYSTMSDGIRGGGGGGGKLLPIHSLK